jgi:hypothetical protein
LVVRRDPGLGGIDDRTGYVRHRNRIGVNGAIWGFLPALDERSMRLVPFWEYALSFWRSVFPACDARKPLL